MRVMPVGGWLLAGALVACGEPTSVDSPGWVRAVIVQGADTSFFYGDGAFTVNPPPYFRMSGFRRTSDERQSLVIDRAGDPRPIVGRYAISDALPADGDFRLFFSTRHGELAQRWVSVSGTFDVTGSDALRVQGTFSATAMIYCSIDYSMSPADLPGYSCDETRPRTDLPVAEIRGSFSVPYDPPGVGSDWQ